MATLVGDARVTVAEVEDLIATDLTDNQVNAFINTANNVVDNNLADKSLSAETLKYIEMWLSAHFLAMRDRVVESERVDGEYVIKYAGDHGMNFAYTQYGQQALLLDSSGTLAQLNEGGKRVTFEAVQFSQE